MSEKILILCAGLLIGVGATYAVLNNKLSLKSSENTGMHGAMEAMTGELSGKTGDEFDKQFLAEMIVHHQGAVAMAKDALAKAQHQELKDMAKAIISAQEQEIVQMQAWQKAWFGH